MTFESLLPEMPRKSSLPARAGIEVAAYDALVNGNCGAASITLTEGGLNAFVVDTSCTSSSHSEGTATTTVYVIDAFARAGVYGSPDYASRRVRSKVTDAS